MRLYRLRFDIWLTLLVATLAAGGAGKLVDAIAPTDHEEHVEKQVAADGDVGGKAGDDVFAANSVDDLLSHDTFTILSDGIAYRNEGFRWAGL